MKKFFLVFVPLFFLANCLAVSAQGHKQIKGLVVDGFDGPIPFAAVTVLNQNIGISTTEDGEFSLFVSSTNMQDTLTVSSLGFKTFSISIGDYMSKKQEKIVMEEDVFEMDEVVLLSPKLYVLEALNRLKDNTISTTHLTEILYRRAATEKGKSKFFVENYIKVRDRGPAYSSGTIQVVQARKSADYRTWKRTQWRHSIFNMNDVNPLRPNGSQHSRNLKKFLWNKIGESTYEGEDVLILEGKNPKKKWETIVFYLGIDSYKIYRIERSKSIFVYKNHKSGKLVLNYFKNEWNFPKWNMPAEILGTDGETLNYKIEAFVYNIETDKKKMKFKSFGGEQDMGTLELPYDASFWENLNTPPDTKFYKKLKKEQGEIFGVPLDVQYALVNK